jgi:hypothetical protein
LFKKTASGQPFSFDLNWLTTDICTGIGFITIFYARRAAAISFFLTHSVLAIPEDLTAAMISSYSGGETRVEMNLPRFSFLGSIGRPTFGVSVIPFSFSTLAAACAAMPATHPQISRHAN